MGLSGVDSEFPDGFAISRDKNILWNISLRKKVYLNNELFLAMYKPFNQFKYVPKNRLFHFFMPNVLDLPDSQMLLFQGSCNLLSNIAKDYIEAKLYGTECNLSMYTNV